MDGVWKSFGSYELYDGEGNVRSYSITEGEMGLRLIVCYGWALRQHYRGSTLLGILDLIWPCIIIIVERSKESILGLWFVSPWMTHTNLDKWNHSHVEKHLGCLSLERQTSGPLCPVMSNIQNLVRKLYKVVSSHPLLSVVSLILPESLSCTCLNQMSNSNKAEAVSFPLETIPLVD